MKKNVGKSGEEKFGPFMGKHLNNRRSNSKPDKNTCLNAELRLLIPFSWLLPGNVFALSRELSVTITACVIESRTKNKSEDLQKTAIATSELKKRDGNFENRL